MERKRKTKTELDAKSYEAFAPTILDLQNGRVSEISFQIGQWGWEGQEQMTIGIQRGNRRRHYALRLTKTLARLLRNHQTRLSDIFPVEG